MFKLAGSVAPCAQLLVDSKLGLVLVLGGNFVGNDDCFRGGDEVTLV